MGVALAQRLSTSGQRYTNVPDYYTTRLGGALCLAVIQTPGAREPWDSRMWNVSVLRRRLLADKIRLVYVS